jgi:hypothetical protein
MHQELSEEHNNGFGAIVTDLISLVEHLWASINASTNRIEAGDRPRGIAQRAARGQRDRPRRCHVTIYRGILRVERLQYKSWHRLQFPHDARASGHHSIPPTAH